MIIYKQQLAQLSAHMMESFKQRAAAALKKKFPAITAELTTEGLYKKIETGVTNAQRYGIEKKEDVMQYLELVIYSGDDFDKKPPVQVIRKILMTVNFSGTEKMDRIREMNIIKTI